SSLFGQQTSSTSRDFKDPSFDLAVSRASRSFSRPLAEIQTDLRCSDNLRNPFCLDWASRPPVPETGHINSFATQRIDHCWTIPIRCADETHGITAGRSRERRSQCLHIRRPLRKVDPTDAVTLIPPHRTP